MSSGSAEIREWMTTHNPLDSDMSDEDEHECDYHGPTAEKLLKRVSIVVFVVHILDC